MAGAREEKEMREVTGCEARDFIFVLWDLPQRRHPVNVC